MTQEGEGEEKRNLRFFLAALAGEAGKGDEGSSYTESACVSQRGKGMGRSIPAVTTVNSATSTPDITTHTSRKS